jgi:hypothetical protein
MKQIEIGTILSGAGFTPVHFGDIPPASPYVVIKPGKDPLARGTEFKIIAHRAKGQIFELDQDIQDIIALLKDELYEDSGYFDPTVFTNNDDDTISREQGFLMVSKY